MGFHTLSAKSRPPRVSQAIGLIWGEIGGLRNRLMGFDEVLLWNDWKASVARVVSNEGFRGNGCLFYSCSCVLALSLLIVYLLKFRGAPTVTRY